MKTAIASLLLFVLIIGAVGIYRANNEFPDRQYYPSTETTLVSVDTDRTVQNLIGAIQIPTISWDDEAQRDISAFKSLHRYLAETYPLIHQLAEIETVNDLSLVYGFTGSDPSLKPILFMAHMDVVPVDDDTLSSWNHPPFEGVVAENQIWGRGTLDDKSSLIALMEAMELQLNNGFRPTRTIYYAFGHDEEVGGPQGAAKIAERFKEKGVEFDFVLDEGGVIVEGLVPAIKQPIAIIGIAEKGFVNIRLTVASAGGHSSTPPNHTAAGILAKAIVKLESEQFPANLQDTNRFFHAAGHFADFSTRLSIANQWLLAPIIKGLMLKDRVAASSMRTTTAVTMLQGSSKSNILPTQASAVANFRIIPGETWETVLARTEKIIDDPRVKLTPFMKTNPSPISASDSRQYQLIEHTIREFSTDILVSPYLVKGGTDSKYFYDLTDSVYRFNMIRINSGNLNSIHGINERITIDDFVSSIQFYYELLNKTSVQID